MIKGKIVKGVGGFYYINTSKDGIEDIYECKAKGVFRKKKEKPLVGDNVKINIVDYEKKLGNIEEILPRTNRLIRPEVANVDQAMIIFAMENPKPNFNLLDRFLLWMDQENVPTVICFNKEDLVSEKYKDEIAAIYGKSGKKIIYASAKNGIGIENIREILEDKTTVVAGPSGVGKSSIINGIFSRNISNTGDISEKIGRGKHTTRHSELFFVGGNTYLFDTPGFSSLKVPEIDKEELAGYYEEFSEYIGECRFLGCTHTHEPNCKVKEMLSKGAISEVRYNNYMQIFDELKEWEKNRYK
ncbi:ribosome small subunit-dependent GTPase A [Eubacterium xylanophilum]|uniref:ribosome small subunit-dependent GTPase A n=1 Tax=Eubacterium xylanophilum TaxID=39497 RepID=UPI0004B93A55